MTIIHSDPLSLCKFLKLLPDNANLNNSQYQTYSNFLSGSYVVDVLTNGAFELCDLKCIFILIIHIIPCYSI